MRRFGCLTKGLQAQASSFAFPEAQSTALPINAAARLFSSAASTAQFTPISQFDSNPGHLRHPSPLLPQQQLTSLLTFPHARSFSSNDSDDLSSPVDVASSVSAFDPNTILDAVTGVEEDGWMAARQDVWFFNRYMQSFLRFAQDATGLPW